MGFAGGWLTGWAAYSDAVRDAFGAAPERIAGFIFLGTPAKQLEERPRPDLGKIVSTLGALNRLDAAVDCCIKAA